MKKKLFSHRTKRLKTFINRIHINKVETNISFGIVFVHNLLLITNLLAQHTTVLCSLLKTFPPEWKFPRSKFEKATMVELVVLLPQTFLSNYQQSKKYGGKLLIKKNGPTQNNRKTDTVVRFEKIALVSFIFLFFFFSGIISFLYQGEFFGFLFCFDFSSVFSVFFPFNTFFVSWNTLNFVLPQKICLSADVHLSQKFGQQIFLIPSLNLVQQLHQTHQLLPFDIPNFSL